MNNTTPMKERKTPAEIEQRKQQLIEEAKSKGFDYDVMFQYEGIDNIHKSIVKDNLNGDLFTYDPYGYAPNDNEYFGIATEHHYFSHAYQSIMSGGKWATVLPNTKENIDEYNEQDSKGKAWLANAYKKHTSTTLEEVKAKRPEGAIKNFKKQAP